MREGTAAVLLALALAGPAASAGAGAGAGVVGDAGTGTGTADLASILALPVAASVVVPASQYRIAVRPAASAGTPVDAALQVAGAFEGLRQLIVQTHDTPESPSSARVVIIRDGLLDDALRTERWEVTLARTPPGGWQVTAARRAWRCRRGAPPAQFDVLPCP